MASNTGVSHVCDNVCPCRSSLPCLVPVAFAPRGTRMLVGSEVTPVETHMSQQLLTMMTLVGLEIPHWSPSGETLET